MTGGQVWPKLLLGLPAVGSDAVMFAPRAAQPAVSRIAVIVLIVLYLSKFAVIVSTRIWDCLAFQSEGNVLRPFPRKVL